VRLRDKVRIRRGRTHGVPVDRPPLEAKAPNTDMKASTIWTPVKELASRAKAQEANSA